MLHKTNDSRDREWREIEQSIDVIPVRLVALETIGNCNRACVYCPVSTAKKRTGRLDSGAVHSVIEQLSEFDYRGKFVFHFYNEPLLDNRILSFIGYAHEHLPNANKLLTTNGDLLDNEKLQYLLEKDFNVAISAHDQEAYRKGQILKEATPLDRRRKIQIRSYYRVGDGTKSVRITNRGGSIDMAQFVSELSREADENGCGRVEFNIDYLGNVHPCCMDFSNGYILGNIHKESLNSIWHKTRNQFKEHYFGNYSKKVCLKCANLV